MPSILASQCRAGRALIEMDLTNLAELADISRDVIAEFEAGRRAPTASQMSAIREALEASGVEFLAENGGGVGVRLRKPAPDPAEIPVESLNASNDE